VNLDGWKSKIKNLSHHFKDLNFQHIHRELNKEADALSKRALNEPKGRLSIYHWENGKESLHSHLNIFEN
jgi:hypothetical protein